MRMRDMTDMATRTRSAVWRYFSKTSEKEAVCDICGETIPTSGNTSNLFKVVFS